MNKKKFNYTYKKVQIHLVWVVNFSIVLPGQYQNQFLHSGCLAEKYGLCLRKRKSSLGALPEANGRSGLNQGRVRNMVGLLRPAAVGSERERESETI